jgi:cysteinyl-tRNA synthetase
VKISKSLGNGVRIQTIVEQGISPEAVRLHVLESHYRSQSKFSIDSLQASANRLQHWYQVASLVWQPIGQESVSEDIKATATKVHEALTNDLNTPQVLSLVDELFSIIETRLLHIDHTEHFREFLDYLQSILGINLEQADITSQQKELLHARQTARDQKDWAQSDELRDKLSSEGIGVRDTPSGPIWFRL